MALQGFDKAYYLGQKLADLQATESEWVGKTTDFLETVLGNVYGLTAEEHYMQYGWQEGLAPNQYFNAEEYKLAKAQQLFDSGKYLTVESAMAAFEDAWQQDPYQHYIQYGAGESINPSNDFDASQYFADKLAALQAADPDTYGDWTATDVQTAFLDAGLTAIEHFMLYGKDEGLTVTAVPAGEQVNPGESTPTVGETFTLTTGIDEDPDFTGGAGNDTFKGTLDDTAGTGTWSGLDQLDGGTGTDIFRVTDTDAAGSAQPGGVALDNIETINWRAAGVVNQDFSAFTDVTAFNVTQGSNVTLTVADAAAVNVTNVTGTATVTGGASQTVEAVGSAALDGAVGAVDATVTSAGAAQTTVDDGTNVDLTVGGLTNDDASINILIGNTTAPTGTINVTATSAYDIDDDADLNMGDIDVTGGTTVTVTQVAATDAVKADALEDDDANTVNQGDVDVTGGSATTEVTVVQDAAKTAVSYDDTTDPITDGVLGVANGAVTIADKNAASATAAGTIATVSLTNYGNSTIDSSALATVNIEGTGGTLGLGRGALTAVPTANTLALNITDATVGTITDSEAAADDGFTTVNITATGDSTVNDLAAADAKTLTVAGAGDLEFTSAALLANVTSVNVTSTGATVFGTTALNVNSTFTSAAGDETVILGATTKAIATGAGDDTVTVGASAITGTVDAGADTDTLVMSDADAVTASANDTFEGQISNFEQLSLTGTTAANQTVNLANLDSINTIAIAGVNVGNTLTLDKVTSGVSVSADTGAAGTIAVTQATDDTSATAADAINFSMSNSAAQTVFKLDASEFETINIASDDSAKTATGIAHNITALDATAAESLSISGDAGVSIGTLTGTALTSIDASGVTKGDVSFTTGALAAAATIDGGAGDDSIDASSATKAVTLSGNAGDDTLIGGAVADTISGGDGDDLIYGDAGADTLTGGAGADIFAVTTATDSNGVNSDTITDFTVGTDFIGLEIGGVGNEAVTYLGEANAYGSVLTSFSGTANEAVLDTSTNTVYVDVDGDTALTAADISINVGVSDLSQSDFATLGTTGDDIIALTSGVDTVWGMGGTDTIIVDDNSATLADVSDDGLSISTVGMDVIADAAAGDIINFTAALATDANYTAINQVAAAGTITKTVAGTEINEFLGLYDYATDSFVSTGDAAADTASTTDVAATMYLYATADGTTADEGIIVIGTGTQLDSAMAGGVLTLA